MIRPEFPPILKLRLACAAIVGIASLSIPILSHLHSDRISPLFGYFVGSMWCEKTCAPQIPRFLAASSRARVPPPGVWGATAHRLDCNKLLRKIEIKTCRWNFSKIITLNHSNISHLHWCVLVCCLYNGVFGIFLYAPSDSPIDDDCIFYDSNLRSQSSNDISKQLMILIIQIQKYRSTRPIISLWASQLNSCFFSLFSYFPLLLSTMCEKNYTH